MDDVVQKIKEFSLKAIISYKYKNFKDFVDSLFLLREESIKLDAEKLHNDFVDFLMDNNMWEWLAGVVGTEPADFDWEAADYVSADLRDLLTNDKIVTK